MLPPLPQKNLFLNVRPEQQVRKEKQTKKAYLYSPLCCPIARDWGGGGGVDLLFLKPPFIAIKRHYKFPFPALDVREGVKKSRLNRELVP